MSCPYQNIQRMPGQDCLIVAHPDRPYDHFCATCGRKVHFSNTIPFAVLSWIFALALAILILISLENESDTMRRSVPSNRRETSSLIR